MKRFLPPATALALFVSMCQAQTPESSSIYADRNFQELADFKRIELDWKYSAHKKLAAPDPDSA
ncbi:MAG: hypothetical protein NTX64_06960, partial [Elusimicrobia bacterium]|nr:hypothetical protein [Elusimicrobiota bacterium]